VAVEKGSDASQFKELGMFDKFIHSLAEKVTVQVVGMLERRLPEIIATVTQVAVREVLSRLNIPQLPDTQLRGVVGDVLSRLGIRR